MSVALRRAVLVAAFRNATPEMRAWLATLKAEADALRSRPDLLWYLLLQSAATQGNAGGWHRLFGKPTLLNSITEASLLALAPIAREARLLATLQAAGIRMQTIKAPRLAANFERIVQMGGVHRATRHMMGLPSRDAKFAFITSFAGIGKKYGRNIWMDIYDESFRQDIAVDERVKRIAEAIGIPTERYELVEAFFQQVARESGLEPWEVDRLLFNFKDHFLTVIVDAA